MTTQNKSIANRILDHKYRIQDCTDFCDISNTVSSILEDCRLLNVTFFDVPSVYNRVKGLLMLCVKSRKRFFRMEDVYSSQSTNPAHHKVLELVYFYKNEYENK